MRWLGLLCAFLLLVQVMGNASAQPTTDPDALREARAMMAKIGIDALAKQQAAAVRAQLMAMVQSVDLGKDKEELLAEYARKTAGGIEARLPKYYDDVSAIYARTFTLEELKELNAFYDSPLGKKVVEKMPTLVKECSDLGQQVGVEVFREAFGWMQSELQKRGITTDAPK
jgi:hypothetical protein